MTGSSGEPRIARVSCRPSMPGIIMSRMASWYGVPRSAASSARRSAEAPSAAHVTAMPHPCSDRASTSRLVPLSSTTSARRPTSSARRSPRLTEEACWRTMRTVNRKVEPAPGVLSASIVPPISSTICFEIASPRPVPPYFLRRRPVGLHEGLEETGHRLGRDSDTGVPHLEAQRDALGRILHQVHPHRYLAGLGELDGVADEVGEHLTQPAGVAHQRVGDRLVHHRHQLEALVLGPLCEQLAHGLDRLPQVELQRLELEPPGLDLREVEDVVDDVQQRFGRDAHRLGIAVLLRRQSTSSAAAASSR